MEARSPASRFTLRRAWLLLGEAAALWSSRNAFQLAAALAFYTLFSLAPLVLILVAITGIVLGEEAARGAIAARIDEFIGPQAARAVEDAVRRSRIEEAGPLPTLLGVGALLFGATTVFAQMQAALNRIWGVEARPSRSGIVVFLFSRLVSLGMVLVLGFLVLVSFAASVAIAALLRFFGHLVPVPAILVSTVDVAFSLVVAAALFAMIFRVLPDVRLAWRDTWRGAFLTAVLFVAGQYLISLYLTHTAPGSAYGAAGSLILVLMWVYYSSLITFFGAAVTKVSMLHEGRPIEPMPTAVKVRKEVVDGGSAADP